MSTNQDKEKQKELKILEEFHRAIDKMDKYERKIYSDEMDKLRASYPEDSPLSLMLQCQFLGHFMAKRRQARFEQLVIVVAMILIFALISFY